MVVNMKEYLIVRQVAEQLDVTQDWVRELIQAKEIKATKIGKWRIRPKDLSEFVKGRSNQSSNGEAIKKSASQNPGSHGVGMADLQVSYSLRNAQDHLDEDINAGILNYLKRVKQISNRNVELEEGTLSARALSEKIFDIIVGTKDTRRGPIPTGENRQNLLEKIRYSIENNKPIESRTSWGAHKLIPPGENNVLDVSELSVIELFNAINQQVKRFYPKGMHFTIFHEDFEGEYIVGNTVDMIESMKKYIQSFRALVTILGLKDVISLISTKSIPKDDEELLEWKNLLGRNLRLIGNYWMESQEKGLQGAQEYASFKALNEIGFFGIISQEMRDYYWAKIAGA